MNVTNLPYDILYHLVRQLDVADEVNLGKTCRLFYEICFEERLARISVEVRHSSAYWLIFLVLGLTCSREMYHTP
jgi:hypothetical protein